MNNIFQDAAITPEIMELCVDKQPNFVGRGNQTEDHGVTSTSGTHISVTRIIRQAVRLQLLIILINVSMTNGQQRVTHSRTIL